MRYLLHNTQPHELAGRQEYLYDIFQMYFLPGQPEGSYIPLMPMGTSDPDILFIAGHANTVWNHLSARIDQIPEKTIVITSCLGYTFGRFTEKRISMSLIFTRHTASFIPGSLTDLASQFLMQNSIIIMPRETFGPGYSTLMSVYQIRRKNEIRIT